MPFNIKKFAGLAVCSLTVLFIQAQPALTFNSVVTREPEVSSSPYKPEPGSVLNHTQVMFEYPEVAKAVNYRLVVIELAYLTGKADTIRKVVVTQNDATTATLVKGLKFSRSYEWYYKATDAAGKEIFRSPKKRFSILYSAYGEKTRNRVTIKKTYENAQGLVSMDYLHAITDRAGNVVWVVPDIPNTLSESHLIRDIRVSPQGTVTFLSQQNVYELSVDGKIRWKGTEMEKSATENFHHDFRRLPSGNYMVLGNETRPGRNPLTNDTATVRYGTITEYGYFGKPVWTWSAKNYFTDQDFFSARDEQGKTGGGLHLNAFSVDATGEFVYAGFRNMNCILKIEKKTGTVVADYRGGFWHQHDANVLPDGSIAIFNNDSILDPTVCSSAMILTPAADQKAPPVVTWKFECRNIAGSDGKSAKMGSVELLPNGNYLINTGNIASVVEVAKNKTMVWEARPETWMEDKKQWVPSKQYRSHYASSLYPCYFTAQVHLSADNKNIIAVAFNEGSEADTYRVIIQDKSRKMPPRELAATGVTAAGKKAEQTIAIAEAALAPGEYEVKIVSVTNPDFFRTIAVTLPKSGN